MAFSSFRVGLVAGKPVREGMVPFLYCSFWFMKSGKCVLGAMSEHRGQYISNKENGHHVEAACHAQFIVPWGDTSAPRAGAIHCAPTCNGLGHEKRSSKNQAIG